MHKWSGLTVFVALVAKRAPRATIARALAASQKGGPQEPPDS
jgi:hypothetical protein